MKKTRLIIAALAAITLVGAVPVQAESAKEKAIQTFNNSINRFKRCIHGKCSRWEIAKVGRDATIAIGVILGLYGIGYAAKQRAARPSAPVPIATAAPAPTADDFEEFDVVKYDGKEWVIDEIRYLGVDAIAVLQTPYWEKDKRDLFEYKDTHVKNLEKTGYKQERSGFGYKKVKIQ